MSIMSRLERGVCMSPPWNVVARRVVLPWAIQRDRLAGDVLEVGAGSGAMAAGLLDSHPDARMTVTDLDPKMMRSAATRLERFGPRARVQVADSTALPFADATFDAAVSFLMLHHVGRWDEALREITRVVRPGGRVWVFDVMESRLWRLAHGISRSEGIRTITVPELERAIPTLPLEHVALRTRGRLWFRLAADVRETGVTDAAPMLDAARTS